MNALVWGVIWSMLPVFELRAGIPIAIAGGINPLLAYVFCVAANLLVFPFGFLFLEFVHYRFLHTRTYRAAFDRVMERTRRKSKGWIEKYGILGLAFLVAIPLPGTGVYTGTLAAWFFGMRVRDAFVGVLIGTLVAGAIVLALSLGGVALFNLL